MITEEIKRAFKDVDPSKGIIEFLGKRQSWIILFNYYNSINEKKIHPGCRPCFPKVYHFIHQLIKKEEVA